MKNLEQRIWPCRYFLSSRFSVFLVSRRGDIRLILFSFFGWFILFDLFYFRFLPYFIMLSAFNLALSPSKNKNKFCLVSCFAHLVGIHIYMYVLLGEVLLACIYSLIHFYTLHSIAHLNFKQVRSNRGWIFQLDRTFSFLVDISFIDEEVNYSQTNSLLFSNPWWTMFRYNIPEWKYDLKFKYLNSGFKYVI